MNELRKPWHFSDLIIRISFGFRPSDFRFARRATFALVLALLPCCLSAETQLWCTGYYPGWEQAGMPASTIDFSVVTHVIQFSVIPNSNGSLDSNINVVSPSNSSNLVQQAHLAGRKTLICVGGANSQAGFQGASSAANRGAFITNLVNFMTSRGYDGIDIDWEPLDASDAGQYTNLVKNLRTALNA